MANAVLCPGGHKQGERRRRNSFSWGAGSGRCWRTQGRVNQGALLVVRRVQRTQHGRMESVEEGATLMRDLGKVSLGRSWEKNWKMGERETHVDSWGQALKKGTWGSSRTSLVCPQRARRVSWQHRSQVGGQVGRSARSLGSNFGHLS